VFRRREERSREGEAQAGTGRGGRAGLVLLVVAGLLGRVALVLRLLAVAVVVLLNGRAETEVSRGHLRRRRLCSSRRTHVLVAALLLLVAVVNVALLAADALAGGAVVVPTGAVAGDVARVGRRGVALVGARTSRGRRAISIGVAPVVAVGALAGRTGRVVADDTSSGPGVGRVVVEALDEVHPLALAPLPRVAAGRQPLLVHAVGGAADGARSDPTGKGALGRLELVLVRAEAAGREVERLEPVRPALALEVELADEEGNGGEADNDGGDGDAGCCASAEPAGRGRGVADTGRRARRLGRTARGDEARDDDGRVGQLGRTADRARR